MRGEALVAKQVFRAAKPHLGSAVACDRFPSGRTKAWPRPPPSHHGATRRMFASSRALEPAARVAAKEIRQEQTRAAPLEETSHTHGPSQDDAPEVSLGSGRGIATVVS
jgi:hypothetical protein